MAVEQNAQLLKLSFDTQCTVSCDMFDISVIVDFCEFKFKINLALTQFAF